MKPIIVISRKDPAGMNISKFISEVPIHYVDTEIINAEKIDEKLEADFIIFASKHQGKKNKMLSLHAPGNWKQADFGGKKGKVCLTSGTILKIFFQELNENKEDWQATLEVTHHGPLIKKPCLFIEIGGTKKDWTNKQAGKAIATTIENAIKDIKRKVSQENPWLSGTAIGIGGPHYCPNFNKIQLNSKYAISHIIPQYAFPITKQVIEEAINKTQEPVSLAIIDWKGLKGEERQETLKLCTELGLKVKKTSEIEK